MDLPKKTILFPVTPNIVYIIGFEKKGEFIPIYVGSSTRNIGRFGDYIAAKFSAQTDFKVGMAVRYLRERGCKVLIRYDETSDHKEAEKKFLRQAKTQGFHLLNDLPGYDYTLASEQGELEGIRRFVDEVFIRPQGK